MLCCCNVHLALAGNIIKDIRTGQQPDGIRLVIDGSSNFNYDAFLLDNPNRLVIDVKDGELKSKPKVEKNKLLDELVDIIMNDPYFINLKSL